MDTCFNYTGETAFFSSDERRWITKIRKLKEQNPDEVTIIRQPEENDGCIYAKLPCSWLKIQPKIKRNFTDEQILTFKERMGYLNSKTHGYRVNEDKGGEEDDEG